MGRERGEGGRRGQATLEYMVTYGWVFIVIMSTIGALSYFGVINPSRWLPDRCELGQQMVCVDYEVSAAGTVKLFVRNNFGKQILVTAANLSFEEGETGSLPATVTIAPGQSKELEISGIDPAKLRSGAKQQLIVHLGFRRTMSTPQHQIAGILYTTVKS